MVFVKICGLREAEHVEVALAGGADAIGLVLTPSPRFVTAATARKLVSVVGGRALTVGVFRGESVDEVVRLASESGVAAVQLHGEYSRDDVLRLTSQGVRVIRAVPFTGSDDDLGAELLLVDAPRAGSGEQWDYSVMAERTIPGRWLLAGGLTPANVAAAVNAATPWGVDVSSGVESSRGQKDPAHIAKFLAAAKP
jgi:phosphoribosylanthranilate isomerase